METTTDKVLKALEACDRGYVSGEALANSLSISRNAVWKHINKLRRLGYEIEASTNNGYRLCTAKTSFAAHFVQKEMRYKLEHFEVLKKCESTNAYVKALAEAGAPSPSAVATLHQTGGRGRRGRKFFSPEDTGLYISFLLRPNIAAEKSLEITTAAAVAVADTLSEFTDKKINIKWVNDVFADGKKVCGILTEASSDLETGKLTYAVLGIGINLFMPEQGFPESIAETAGSVFDTPYDCELKVKLCAKLADRICELPYRIGRGAFIDRYRRYSFVAGRNVNLISPTSTRQATVIDISDDYSLLVRFADGKVEKINSGEISLRPGDSDKW